MQACYIERYGDATELRIGDRPEPQPGPGELVFRMAAASINPIDFKTRDGLVKAILPYKMPDRKSTRLNSSHSTLSRMPSSA